MPVGADRRETDSTQCCPKGEAQRSQKFLHTHKLGRPQTYEARLEAFAKAGDGHVNTGMVKAKSLLAVARARQLRTLQTSS